MRFQEKLTNFFASAYSNNSKYNSSFLVNLRLLFERNNKFKSTFEKLGNVFRNSKWNDFKVQNIKTPLINSWLINTLFILLSCLLIFSFFGYSNSNNTFFLPAFISEVWGLVFFLFAQFSNIILLSFIKLSFLALSIKYYITRLLGFNTNFIFDTFTQTTKLNTTQYDSKEHKHNLTLTYNLTTNTVLSSDTLKLSYSLSKALQTLAKINDSNTYQKFILSLQTRQQTSNEFLLYDILDFGYNNSSIWKPNNITQDITIYKPNFRFFNKAINLNLKELNLLSNNVFMAGLSNFNIYTNLQQSKQNRWLLKNSILSNTSNLELFHFTQAKSLVGNAVFNSSITSQNIWNSSKLTQASQTSELVKLSLFQNLNLNKELFNNNNYLKLNGNTPSGLSNFDHFETSLIWNTKKYFFNNQLKSNTLQLINTKNENNTPYYQSNSNSSKLNVLLNFQNISLTTQLNNLSYSLFNETAFTESIPMKTLNNFYSISFNDSDQLNTYNTYFLITLSTSNSTNNVLVYSFNSNKHYLSPNTNSMSFKS